MIIQTGGIFTFNLHVDVLLCNNQRTTERTENISPHLLWRRNSARTHWDIPRVWHPGFWTSNEGTVAPFDSPKQAQSPGKSCSPTIQYNNTVCNAYIYIKGNLGFS